MKALTVKQPWAYLISAGIKDTENRTWKCPEKYIGKRVLIHAGLAKQKSMQKSLSIEQMIAYNQADRRKRESEGLFYNGCILGSVIIKDCIINHPSIWADKTRYIVELECGCWIAEWNGDPGRTLLLENAKRFTCEGHAKTALCDARKYRPFKNAKIIAENSIYNWILEDAILFDNPILNVKGKLGFWESNYEMLVCPKCGNPCLHDNTDKGIPGWGNPICKCDKCGEMILESEFEFL